MSYNQVKQKGKDIFETSHRVLLASNSHKKGEDEKKNSGKHFLGPSNDCRSSDKDPIEIASFIFLISAAASVSLVL